MTDEGSRSIDIFGIKPVADATKIATDGAVKGAGAFLSRICLPAAEEFGFLLRDRVSGWRAAHATKIVEKAATLTEQRQNANLLHGHPRLIMMAIEEGSWSDADEVQDMWAGLLSSSCTIEGKDEDNLIFLNILKQLTTLQAKIINYAVEHAPKSISHKIFTLADSIRLKIEDVCAVFGCEDVHALDYQMDHLREIGLFEMPGGFDVNTGEAVLAPSALAISFYVRCQGFVGTPKDYFGNLPEATGEQSATETVGSDPA